MHHNIYIMYNNLRRGNNPLHQQVTPFYLLREPASLLVVTNTHPPLSLVCQQLLHPLAFTPLTLSHPTVHITLYTVGTKSIGADSRK
jgi:hypothetical protein